MSSPLVAASQGFVMGLSASRRAATAAAPRVAGGGPENTGGTDADRDETDDAGDDDLAESVPGQPQRHGAAAEPGRCAFGQPRHGQRLPDAQAETEQTPR